VYSWNAGTNSWERYSPGLPNFVNNLRTLRQGEAYWFIATTPVLVPFVP